MTVQSAVCENCGASPNDEWCCVKCDPDSVGAARLTMLLETWTPDIWQQANERAEEYGNLSRRLAAAQTLIAEYEADMPELRHHEQVAKGRQAAAEQRADTAERQLTAALAQIERITAEYEAFKQTAGAAPGWVYIIQERSEGHYKIGKAKDAEIRTRTFEVKLPFKIDPVCRIPAGNRHQLERDLHAMFAHKHVDGEWYALDESDVAFLKSLAGK